MGPHAVTGATGNPPSASSIAGWSTCSAHAHHVTLTFRIAYTGLPSRSRSRRSGDCAAAWSGCESCHSSHRAHCRHAMKRRTSLQCAPRLWALRARAGPRLGQRQLAERLDRVLPERGRARDRHCERAPRRQLAAGDAALAHCLPARSWASGVHRARVHQVDGQRSRLHVFLVPFFMHSYMQALQQYYLLGAMHHTHVRPGQTWPQGTQPATNAAGNMFAGDRHASMHACSGCGDAATEAEQGSPPPG